MFESENVKYMWLNDQTQPNYMTLNKKSRQINFCLWLTLIWSEIWCSLHSRPELACGWDDIKRTWWKVPLPQLRQKLFGKASSSKTCRDSPERDPHLYCLSENLQDTECSCNSLHKTTPWRSCVTMDHEIMLRNSCEIRVKKTLRLAHCMKDRSIGLG